MEEGIDATSEIRFRALPKQMAFIRSTKGEVLFSGALGSGKTVSLCLKVAMRAQVPGAREGLCRRTRADLEATTLKTLLEGDGEMPAILPAGTYTHNKTTGVIKINKGGEINCFGLVDASEGQSRVGSRNLTGLGIDQAEEVPEALYLSAVARVRVPVKGLVNQTYLACNPGPPSHHLAIRFGITGAGAVPDTEVFLTQSTDNPFLPPKYIALLNTFKGVRHKRFVLGMWVGSDGLVYDHWSRDVNLIERDGPWARYLVGVDDGYTNPFVGLLAGLDGDGRVHVIRELYEPGLLPEQRIEALRRLVGELRPDTVLVDPSAPDIIALAKAANLPAIGANNDVIEGIDRVQQRLSIAGDGRPRLTVSPTCANLRDEFESYEWKTTTGTGKLKDEPKKENDHAADALRYIISHLDRSPAMLASWITTGGPAPKQPPQAGSAPSPEDDHMWEEQGLPLRGWGG